MECKNYASPVDQREVDKFMSDLLACSAGIGLFVSLKSSIRGKRAVEVLRAEDRLVGFVVL